MKALEGLLFLQNKRTKTFIKKIGILEPLESYLQRSNKNNWMLLYLTQIQNIFMRVVPKRLHAVPGGLHKSRCPPLPRDINQPAFIVQDAVMNCSATYARWLTRAQKQVVGETNLSHRATVTNCCAKNEGEIKPPPQWKISWVHSFGIWSLNLTLPMQPYSFISIVILSTAWLNGKLVLSN